MSERPQVGQVAPRVRGMMVGGALESAREYGLEESLGKWVVLYFYPKDQTSGCTKQACALRDGWDEISKYAQVIGVSGDSIKSHEKFIATERLPFALWSDVDHEIAQAYGVWVEKSMYGRTYMGMERTTFVIDGEGVIRAIFPKVKPDQHFGKVMEVLTGQG